MLERLDVLIELSTLGEYGVDAHGRPIALEGADADNPCHAVRGPGPSTANGSQRQRRRDDCPWHGAATPGRCAWPAPR